MPAAMGGGGAAAGVGRVEAACDLDERGLARAILADQRHHLARRDRERDLSHRRDAPEALDDAAQLEQRGFTGSYGCRGGRSMIRSAGHCTATWVRPSLPGAGAANFCSSSSVAGTTMRPSTTAARRS